MVAGGAVEVAAAVLETAEVRASTAYTVKMSSRTKNVGRTPI
jgi:hypothetical protein